MNLREANVADALDALRERSLVVEGSGARVAPFVHNFQRAVGVSQQSAVLLGSLMLRGPQTAAELRLNTERWDKFLNVAPVDAFLNELQDRSADKGDLLVQKMPKAQAHARRTGRIGCVARWRSQRWPSATVAKTRTTSPR